MLSAKSRPGSASHSTPFSLSFTQMSKMHSYSALTDPHCVMTRSKGFRSHFAKVVGPYSLAASLSVKPNLDLDYSKRSVRERVRPMTANLALVGEVSEWVTARVSSAPYLTSPRAEKDPPSSGQNAPSHHFPSTDRPFHPQKSPRHLNPHIQTLSQAGRRRRQAPRRSSFPRGRVRLPKPLLQTSPSQVRPLP